MKISYPLHRCCWLFWHFWDDSTSLHFACAYFFFETILTNVDVFHNTVKLMSSFYDFFFPSLMGLNRAFKLTIFYFLAFVRVSYQFPQFIQMIWQWETEINSRHSKAFPNERIPMLAANCLLGSTWKLSFFQSLVYNEQFWRFRSNSKVSHDWSLWSAWFIWLAWFVITDSWSSIFIENWTICLGSWRNPS